jgi:hypothetical protein
MTAENNQNKFISNWRTYHDFLKTQDEFLADVFAHYKGQKPKYEYERVLSGLLHRYAMNFRVVYRSWEDFGTNSTFKFSVYSLLRPLVADFLLMLYLLEDLQFEVPKDGNPNKEWRVIEDGVTKRYDAVTSSFFERVDSNLKKKLRAGEISSQEMDDIIKHHRKEFPEYFAPDAKLGALKKKGFTPSQLADQIVRGKYLIKDLYDYYFRLSQFEHFTFITEGLMNDVDRNWEMIHIVEVTNYLIDYLGVNLNTLRVPAPLKERLIILTNQFRSIAWMYNQDQVPK